MIDVFISYAREDLERARALAATLEARGWSVWWDRKIVAGQTFDQTIEQQLQTARCVVVLWSRHSIDSEWVRNEAAVASERDVLVPVLLDDVKQPLEFRRRQAADLTRWTGDFTDPGFQGLCEGIAAKAPPVSGPQAGPAPVTRGAGWRRAWPAAAVAVAAVLVVMVALSVWRSSTVGPVSLAGPAPVDGKARVASGAVVNAPPAETRGIDNPLPLKLGATSRMSLQPNQAYYLRLTEPVKDVKIVLDMRLPGNRSSNLQSRLSVLDPDGAVLQERVIAFNEIDVGARKTVSWSTREAARIGFKLLNGSKPADFWFTVRRPPAPAFVPFFGSVVPAPLSLEKDSSGLLDPGEDAYYAVSLQPGEYRAVLDFANAQGRNTNIQGLLALLDADGGNVRKIISFNEIDVSYRKIAAFPVRAEGPVILNVQNDSEQIRYSLRLSRTP